MATTSKRRKRTPKSKPLPTIWEIPDDLWLRIKPILEKFWPRKLTGRRHANWRLILNGISFRMRSGCQWDQLPRKFGPKSTVHDWFQRWCADGVGRKSGVRAEIRCRNPVSVHHSCLSKSGVSSSFLPEKTNCRVGKGRPAGSIELRVSPSPSKIPYGGFSPVRLQMDRQWRPSTTSRGLSAVHIRPMRPSYTPPQLQLPGIRDPRRDYPFENLSVQCGTTPNN